MQRIVVDTSVVIAVILNEPEKKKLIEVTQDAELIAPSAMHWEIGNAFSAMFKKKRLKFKEAVKCLKEYKRIPILFFDIDLEIALHFAEKDAIYAYDAYFLTCAKKHKAPLLTLDTQLSEVAQKNKIRVLEV